MRDEKDFRTICVSRRPAHGGRRFLLGSVQARTRGARAGTGVGDGASGKICGRGEKSGWHGAAAAGTAGRMPESREVVAADVEQLCGLQTVPFIGLMKCFKKYDRGP